MEILSLKAAVTEQDLNDLLRKHGPKIEPVEDLKIRIAPEGLYVEGVYPLLVNVKFEALWELSVESGKVAARLANLRALGIPASLFRTTVLKLIAEAVKSDDWLEVDHETVRVDVDRLLLKEGLTARTNLRAVSCQSGTLLLECAADPSS
jgi:hypothetical protein